MFDLPKRLWNQLVLASNISQDMRWADINKSQLENLSKYPFFSGKIYLVN